MSILMVVICLNKLNDIFTHLRTQRQFVFMKLCLI